MMKADLIVKNGWLVTPQETVRGGVAVSDGKLVAIGTDESLPDGNEVIDAKGRHILPGLIDGWTVAALIKRASSPVGMTIVSSESVAGSIECVRTSRISPLFVSSAFNRN